MSAGSQAILMVQFYNGDPTGNIAPNYVGSICLDTSGTGLFYNSTGLTDADWQLPTSSGAYASLTGGGETASPGDLTQAGGFTVNDTAGDGIALSSAGSSGQAYMLAKLVQLISNVAGGLVEIQAQGANGNVLIQAQGANGVINVNAIDSAGELILSQGLGSGATITLKNNQIQLTLPTSDPGGSGIPWNNGGVVYTT